jgi:hypothetical protein
MGKFKSKRKSAEAKRNISRGVKSYWQKRGKKDAAKVIGTALVGTGLVIGARKGGKKAMSTLDNFIESRSRNMSKAAVKGATSGAVQGAGQGVAKGVENLAQDAKKVLGDKVNVVAELPKQAVNLGKETRKAVQEGLNTPSDPNSKLNQGARWLARQRAKMEKRAKSDMKKLGFERELQDIGLIEFAKTQRRKRKTRTAAEKAAISQGLREYYAGQPKAKTSALDKVDRGALSINRVTGAASNVLSTAALGLSLAGQLKAMTYKPSRGERVFQNVSAGAGLLSSLSGSYRGFGTGTRSLAGSANIYDDLRLGAKTQKRNYQYEALGVKRDVNKTKRQSQAAKIRIERQRNRLKKEELGIKQRTAGSYGTIAITSARSNRPGGTKYEDARTRRAKLDADQLKNLPEWQ